MIILLISIKKITGPGEASYKDSKSLAFILGKAFKIVFNFILFATVYIYVLHSTISSTRADAHLFLLTIVPRILLQFLAYSRCSVILC